MITEQELERVKAISIRGYLSAKGIEPVKDYGGYSLYLSPFREEGMPSFKVDHKLNLWYDFGENRGGSIIDLVMRLEDCGFYKALKSLDSEGVISYYYCKAERYCSVIHSCQYTSVKGAS